MAVGDAHVFPGFLTPVLTQISFQSHRLLFSHASAKARGENTPERNFASTRYRTHNHQVMSQKRSPLSQPGGTLMKRRRSKTLWERSRSKSLWEKEKMLVNSIFTSSPSVFKQI